MQKNRDKKMGLLYNKKENITYVTRRIMKLYFAPLEGITTYTYRNTHAEFFGGCDAYFAPFITPSDNERLSIKSLRDIVPGKNQVMLIPQVLTNQSQSFTKFEDMIKDLGYKDININLGCPSGTVVKKNRGSGFLRDPLAVDCFLAQVYESSGLRVSVKTRSGFSSGLELEKLIEIYNKYPMESLIIHPRTREEFYKGEPDMAVFDAAFKASKNPVCYNGNIFSMQDYKKVVQNYPELEGVMIGRGAIANPAIFREIKGGRKTETAELAEFTQVLAERYLKVLGSEVYTLHKLKEIWLYTMWMYPAEKKLLKAIKKSNRLADIMAAVKALPRLEEG